MSATCWVVRSPICFSLVTNFALKLEHKHCDIMIVNSELNLPEEMSSLFCCSVSTSSFASLILSFIRSAVSLDLRAISDLAAVLFIIMMIIFSHIALFLIWWLNCAPQINKYQNASLKKYKVFTNTHKSCLTA